MNMVPLPRRGVAWLPLVILVSCLYLAFSVSFLPSFASALRTNNKPTDSTGKPQLCFLLLLLQQQKAAPAAAAAVAASHGRRAAATQASEASSFCVRRF